MFYRLRKARNTRRLNGAIAGILDTPPLRTKTAPWCIASMVAKGDVAMYLLALKSFYPKLGRGKVAVIIDRDMPQASRDILTHHAPGLEFVILEDIPSGGCQRGGTWERFLYVLDRSENEYTIQLDADTLAVSDDLDEVVDEAEATPSDHIGIVTERMFARYQDRGKLYVRGLSGVAGFSRGSFTRDGISRFHEVMEKLVGKGRWGEWGTEQCGLNFAIANSPGAVILPYPEYASFTPHSARQAAKFFHFIGANRFGDDYYAARGQEIIAKLRPSFTQSIRAKPQRPREDARPFAFTRALAPDSALRYQAWRLGGRRTNVWLRLRSEREFPGPEFQLRPPPADNGDFGVAYEVFVHRYLQAAVRIPPERVKLIVDFGANVGMSCLYWLAAYRRAEVMGFEPHPGHAAQCRKNLDRNGFLPRMTLHEAAAGAADGRTWMSDAGTSSRVGTAPGAGYEIDIVDAFPLLSSRRIDILKIDIEGGEYALLEDPRFASLDIRAIIMEWHQRDTRPHGGAWCRQRLEAIGFQIYTVFEKPTHGMFWAYRRQALFRAPLPRGHASQ